MVEMSLLLLLEIEQRHPHKRLKGRALLTLLLILVAFLRIILDALVQTLIERVWEVPWSSIASSIGENFETVGLPAETICS